MKKRIIKWIKILLLTYVIIGAVFYFLQDRILFHPVSLKPEYKYDFKQSHRDINMKLDSVSNLNVIEFTAGDSVKGVVLYFHGNKKNISWYAKYADNFTKHGYEVWMIDYPGYGKSTGRFTEEDLYRYAEALYQVARLRFVSDSIIIYGKSMGTGIAAELASTHLCKQLILETPYYSFTELGKQYLPIYPVEKMLHYKMPTYHFLADVKVPVTIFHGTNDWVIPYSNAVRLKPMLKPIDEFITIEGGSHNDLNKYPLFHQKLDSLLK
ncbi:MAG: alpha/beta fold hydrolase [Sphingobacteriales bacterium]|nr:alpha/beta fold hydrolase [Sphingobacteriales bacterium]MBI3720519.1 alpha/beta fold hydrolase [Sphingobacteriales bacterium]